MAEPVFDGDPPSDLIILSVYILCLWSVAEVSTSDLLLVSPFSQI